MVSSLPPMTPEGMTVTSRPWHHDGINHFTIVAAGGETVFSASELYLALSRRIGNPMTDVEAVIEAKGFTINRDIPEEVFEALRSLED